MAMVAVVCVYSGDFRLAAGAYIHIVATGGRHYLSGGAVVCSVLRGLWLRWFLVAVVGLAVPRCALPKPRYPKGNGRRAVWER